MIADSPLQFTAMIGGSKLERICCPDLETYRITVNNRTQARVVVVYRPGEVPEQVSSFVLKLLAKHKCKE